METLTDHKCRSKVKALLATFADEYETAFEEKPSDAFWSDLLKIDTVLSERLKVRPIGTMEIDAACKQALLAFRSLVKREQRTRSSPSESRT